MSFQNWLKNGAFFFLSLFSFSGRWQIALCSELNFCVTCGLLKQVRKLLLLSHRHREWKVGPLRD